MNLLFDFIPFQDAGGVGGAAGFTKAVLDEIIRRKSDDVQLFAVYDSSVPVGRLFDYRLLAEQYHIALLNISQKPISEMIAEHHIDVFFISVGQFYGRYNLEGITCKTIMFIHDIFDIEAADNRIELAVHDANIESRWQWTKRMVNILSGRWDRQREKSYRNIISLYAAPNTLAYTVSEYTAQALQYYFPEIHDIRVCYSPARNVSVEENIHDTKLRQLIEQGSPYLLLLAANRRFKNAHALTKVFKRLHDEYPELHLLTLKYGKSIDPQHIDIPFLSDSDLQHAYIHAKALVFASFFEGFGYPPIEALRYGTQVVASNTTSIPEILGDAGIYFSPFYPADLYQALKKALSDNHTRNEDMQKRYTVISQRQEEDLRNLVEELLTHNDRQYLQ